MFILERLFDAADSDAVFDSGNTTHRARIDKLKKDLDPDTNNDQSFLSIALKDPLNIRAVQWIDDYLYRVAVTNRGSTGAETAKAKKEREIYLKSWCNLHWEDGDDQKMLSLHETEEAWHEDNQFFVMLLSEVLQKNRPSSPPASAGWWKDWTGAAWDSLAGDDDAAKVKTVFAGGEWRSGTKNICDNDLPFDGL